MRAEYAAGLVFVVVLHVAGLYGLLTARVIPPPTEAATLFVNFVDPQDAPPQPQVPTTLQPPKREAPPPSAPTHYHLAAQAPVTSPADLVEPLPPPVAAPTSASAESPALLSMPSAPPELAGPVVSAAELAVTCPERSPPKYPLLARRLGESGKVVLRVELDEVGRVSEAHVLRGSGSNRLDAAALAAVRTWHCVPAQRDGQAVRSVAMQPFNFTLEGD